MISGLLVAHVLIQAILLLTSNECYKLYLLY